MTARARWHLHAFVVEVTSPGFTRRARKFLVALLGVAGQLLVAGVIPAPWDARVQVALALATALGVYGVSNEVPSTSSTDGP